MVERQDKVNFVTNTNIAVDSYTFEVAQEIVYQGNNINRKKRPNRITLAKTCYYGITRQLSSKTLFRPTKLTLYKNLFITVQAYGAESWTLSVVDANSLGTFEKNNSQKDLSSFFAVALLRCYCKETEPVTLQWST